MTVAIALSLLLLVAAISLAALFKSRFGSTAWHRVAFWSGTAGLVSLPLSLVGLLGLALQFWFADFSSPLGLAFVGGAVLAVAAATTSLVVLVMLGRARPTAG